MTEEDFRQPSEEGRCIAVQVRGEKAMADSEERILALACWRGLTSQEKTEQASGAGLRTRRRAMSSEGVNWRNLCKAAVASRSSLFTETL